MNAIKRSGTKFELSHFPWQKDFPSCPKTYATISWSESAFKVHFESYETNLRLENFEHNSRVCQDSCVEFFFQFSPDTDARYLNLEINPNCAVYAALRYDRKNSSQVSVQDINMLKVSSQIFDDHWELNLQIPLEFIQKFFASFKPEIGAKLRGNLYKCGDLTDHPHYGAFANVLTENPDFHRPEFFEDFVLED